MEHVVFYPGPGGSAAFSRFTSMADAVAFVERLRNVDGILEASLFVMTPVPMVVRTVYKVEVPPTQTPPTAEAPAVEVTPVFEPGPALTAPESDATAAAFPAAAPEPLAAVDAYEAMPDGGEPVLAGTADITPSQNGRRTLGFFSH